MAKRQKKQESYIKTGILTRLLIFIVATLIVNALLVAGAFTYISRNVFANMKSDELVPKASFIARLVSQYQRGEISQRTLETTLMSDMTLWDATLHVFDENGDIIARSVTPGGEETQERLLTYLPEITESGTWRLVITTQELGIVVGVPVYGVDAAITGAVFLTKPLKEVNTALSGLNSALLISSVIVLLVVLLPAYIGSRGFTRPMRQMSAAARAMAAGNFSIRADDTRKDETGELGHSLNELSQALSHTIGDLMLERNRLRNVLDGLNEGVIAVDADGAVTHCNPAAYKLLRVSENDADGANKALLALMTDRELLETSVLLVTLNDIELRVTVTELTDAEGRHFGFVSTLQDVTEEVRLEQTRRDYVANVSHELRTPIASIRGLSEALSDGMVKKDADKNRYYGYILRESMRLGRLIDDLLELSRLQTGGVALICSRFDLRIIVLELGERFAELAEEKGHSFSLSLPDCELYVNSNTDRVEQVLICLLDNAVKYSSGAIMLSVKPGERELVISVESEGRIDEKHLAHLFERFYKADEAHAEEGTGLGLSIAREVVALLGGRIWAQNIENNACFNIALPVE